MNSNNPIMDKLWDKLPKNKDGTTVTYWAQDIPYLYAHGFVDTQNHTLEAWQNAFLPYKKPDGTFVLNKAQFLTLDVYRYKEPVGEPFEPQKLREGVWPDYELALLWESTLKRHSSISFEEFELFINEFKHQGQTDKTGSLVVNQAFKKALQDVLDIHPSPKHILAKEVKKIRQKNSQNLAEKSKKRESSLFTTGQTLEEHRFKELKNLEGASTQHASSTQKTNTPEIDVKSLKKPSPKLRG